MTLHEVLWDFFSVGLHGFARVYENSRAFTRICEGFRGFTRLHEDSRDYSRVHKDSQKVHEGSREDLILRC